MFSKDDNVTNPAKTLGVKTLCDSANPPYRLVPVRHVFKSDSNIIIFLKKNMFLILRY